jgi:hypothetical protein
MYPYSNGLLYPEPYPDRYMTPGTIKPAGCRRLSGGSAAGTGRRATE